MRVLGGCRPRGTGVHRVLGGSAARWPPTGMRAPVLATGEGTLGSWAAPSNPAASPGQAGVKSVALAAPQLRRTHVLSPTIPARHPSSFAFRSTSNRLHTTSKRCFITKSRLRYTVHCGRLRQNRHVHLVHPQYLHWPRLLTRCCRSNMTTPVINRTVFSSSSVGAICSFLWS